MSCRIWPPENASPRFSVPGFFQMSRPPAMAEKDRDRSLAQTEAVLGRMVDRGCLSEVDRDFIIRAARNAGDPEHALGFAALPPHIDPGNSKDLPIREIIDTLIEQGRPFFLGWPRDRWCRKRRQLQRLREFTPPPPRYERVGWLARCLPSDRRLRILDTPKSPATRVVAARPSTVGTRSAAAVWPSRWDLGAGRQEALDGGSPCTVRFQATAGSFGSWHERCSARRTGPRGHCRRPRQGNRHDTSVPPGMASGRSGHDWRAGRRAVAGGCTDRASGPGIPAGCRCCCCRCWLLRDTTSVVGDDRRSRQRSQSMLRFRSSWSISTPQNRSGASYCGYRSLTSRQRLPGHPSADGVDRRGILTPIGGNRRPKLTPPWFVPMNPPRRLDGRG